MKFIKNNTSGFTLIELLLVMAIIGILAGTITIGMKASRQRARVTAALKLGNNILAEAADCYLKNGTFGVPTPTTGGGLICGTGSGTWPAPPKQCSYGSFNSNTLKNGGPFTIVCGSDTVTCNISDSRCVKSNP